MTKNKKRIAIEKVLSQIENCIDLVKTQEVGKSSTAIALELSDCWKSTTAERYEASIQSALHDLVASWERRRDDVELTLAAEDPKTPKEWP